MTSRRGCVGGGAPQLRQGGGALKRARREARNYFWKRQISVNMSVAFCTSEALNTDSSSKLFIFLLYLIWVLYKDT